MPSYGNLRTSWAAAPEVGGMDGLEFSDLSELKFQAFATEEDDTLYKEAELGTVMQDTEQEMFPPYNAVDAGINFVGLCKNKRCRANGEEVTCSLDKGGFGSFDLDKDTCNCKCPVCGKVCASIITCNFYACKWKFEGMLAAEGVGKKHGALKYMKKAGEGSAKASDGYFEYKGKLTRWRYLHFDVFSVPSDTLKKFLRD